MSSVKALLREVDLISKLQSTGSRSGPRINFDKLLLKKLQGLERIFGLRPGHDFFTGDTVISPNEIKLCDELVFHHPLAKHIRSKSPISPADLTSILESLQFDVHLFSSGAIPAGINPASDYSQHTWTRDAAIIAYALASTKHIPEARQAISNIASFYCRPEQRSKFIGFLYSDDPAGRYRFGNPNRDLPHIRARINEQGYMVESDQDWSHSQLDAIGMWLYVTFALANAGVLDLHALDTHISENVNAENKIDSILSVAIKFLNRIRFWDQYDHGPWEDRLEPSRASSVGICVAALKQAQTYFEGSNWNSIQIFNPDFGPKLRDEISLALLSGSQVLTRRIPRSGIGAIETESYPSDSALAFLLFPFNPGLTGSQERAILRNLYEDRMGDVGFTRRAGDEYLGMDYPFNTHSPSFCDLSAPGYRAAEWTLFDPLISAYYFERYIDSGGMNTSSFALGEAHLKRSLSHITKGYDKYVMRYDGRQVETPRMRIPEAFWFDSARQRWRANENTPLLMAEAACAMMLEKGIQATKLWELAKARRKSRANR